IQGVVKLDTKVGIVPADARPPKFSQEEPQVFLDHVQFQALIGHDRIDTETARIGTAQAAEHRNDLEEGCFLKSRLNELPALPYAGKRRGLSLGRNAQT